MLTEFRAAERISPREWLAFAVLVFVPLALLATGVWLLVRAFKGGV